MSDSFALSWSEANDRYLMAAVDVVRALLETHAADLGNRSVDDRTAEAAATLEETSATLPGPSTLDRLCALFGLSPFERGVMLLCLGIEVDASFAALCAAAHGNSQHDYPTFRLALDAFPNPHWSALSPVGSLRRWRLLEVGPGSALTTSSLRLAERTLHYLRGVDHLDERLAGLLETLTDAPALAPSHRALAQRIAALWEPIQDAASFPAVQLVGAESSDRRAIAFHACRLSNHQVRALPAQLLPTRPEDLESLRRLWELEGALSSAALLIEGDEIREGDGSREEALSWLAGRVLGPVLISGDRRRRARHRPLVTFEIEMPKTIEQRDLWRAALGATGKEFDLQVEQLASQFHLGAPAIRAAAVDALARLETSRDSAPSEPGPDRAGALIAALWDACRVQARPRLDDLAQRIEPSATWNELVLPDAQRRTLQEVAIHVRRRLQVYERWGFADKGRRGLGISTLFAGASGTGKTMAAEVLAGELRLDLYRVDLAAIVSKYIGETEKNLRRVFDAAEAGGVILLFDEADALFGKRTGVQDSHDRHANIEVSYLLQRMETYRGLAILTTNMKSALDVAFLRRIRFILDFPFPDAELRAEIWRQIFPDATPTEGLDPNKLAQLAVAGGNIRNIAMNAAFLAADAEEPVRMGHLLRSARGEYAKLKKTLNPADVRGWMTGSG